MIRKLFGRAAPASPNAAKHFVAVDGRQNGLDPAMRAQSAFKRRPTHYHPVEQAPKRGMWVVAPGGELGIIIDLQPGDLFRVQIVEKYAGTNQVEQYVNDQGLQAYRNLIRVVPGNLLRQALHDEIPSPRRPIEDVSRRLGYLV